MVHKSIYKHLLFNIRYIPKRLKHSSEYILRRLPSPLQILSVLTYSPQILNVQTSLHRSYTHANLTPQIIPVWTSPHRSCSCERCTELKVGLIRRRFPKWIIDNSILYFLYIIHNERTYTTQRIRRIYTYLLYKKISAFSKHWNN